MFNEYEDILYEPSQADLILEEFKNKEIIVPFRADMPDIIFQALIKKANLNIKKDFKLTYVATPIDAMQMLILRRADHALLAEPAISIALRKTEHPSITSGRTTFRRFYPPRVACFPRLSRGGAGMTHWG